MTDATYRMFPKDDNVYVFMVRSYSFLAKAIRFFMKFKQRSLKKQTIDLYNHADLYLGSGMVVGAERRGIYPKSLSAMYDDDKRRYIVVYKVPLTTEQKRLVFNWSMNQAGKKYEFSNFFNQIFRILFIAIKGKEKWLGHRASGAQKKYFCSEFVSTALCQVIPEFSNTPWDDDPMDLKELCDKKLIYITTIKF